MTAATLQITSPAEAEEAMAAARAAREAEQAAPKVPQPEPRVAGRAMVTFQGGQMAVETSRAKAVTIQDQRVPSGFVRLSTGTITPVAAAQAAGLMHMVVEIPREDRQSFRDGPAQAPAPVPSNTTGQQQNTNAERGTVAVDEAGKASITAAETVLNQATEAIGATAVAALHRGAVSSGELPSNLPEGVTTEMVSAVAAGYEQQANAVLRDTGATVEALTTFLNPNELRDARLAAYQGNDAKLREMGGRAMERLHSLPNDPVLLKELTGNWPAGVRLEHRGNVAWVTTPKWSMSWREAVNAGKIRF